MRIVHPALAVGLALAIAACATTPAPGPVSVTRFVDPAAGARVAGENFFVESAPGSAMPPEQLAAFKAAVAAELVERGYIETPREGATLIAQVRAESAVAVPAARKRGPVSVGVGGSTGSYGSGVGLGLGINLGGGGPKETRDTELGVMLRDAQSGATFWEGRAQFSVSVDSPLAASQANATAIAEAMFRDYPGNNGETTEVRVQE
jgi:hypothetical protein